MTLVFMESADDELSRQALTLAQSLGGDVRAVTIDGPYAPSEVIGALDIHLGARLPHDPSAAAVLSDGATAGPRFGRSALMRAAGQVAGRIGRVPSAEEQAEAVLR